MVNPPRPNGRRAVLHRERHSHGAGDPPVHPPEAEHPRRRGHRQCQAAQQEPVMDDIANVRQFLRNFRSLYKFAEDFDELTQVADQRRSEAGLAEKQAEEARAKLADQQREASAEVKNLQSQIDAAKKELSAVRKDVDAAKNEAARYEKQAL